MPIQIVWDVQGRDEIRQLNPDARRRIRRALRDIDRLWSRDVIPLRGFPGLFRLKVDDYLVVLRERSGRSRYTIDRAAHRDDVYDDYPIPEELG